MIKRSGFGELYEVSDNFTSIARANGCKVDREKTFIQTEGDVAKIVMEYKGIRFEVVIHPGVVQ